MIRQDPVAWSLILRRQLGSRRLTVEAVNAMPAGRKLTRYQLRLAGHSDPITLIGKRTNLVEACFYQTFGRQLSFLTARCWFSHAGSQQGWIILDDVPDHRPWNQWQEKDLERAVGNLAALHIAFWNQEALWQGQAWLPHLLAPVPPIHRWAHYLPLVDGQEHTFPLLSDHAQQNAGPLLHTFRQAARFGQRLRELGGWPGVVEQKHLEAITSLLDDPMAMLYPLRRLPPTLLHNNLAPRHWHLTLFGDANLLDWRRASVGPAVCDLVGFVEQVEEGVARRGGGDVQRDWPTVVETLVDSYLLRLYEAMWPFVDVRAIRQAMPAARCLYLFTQWVPRLNPWLERLGQERDAGRAVLQLDQRGLKRAGFPAMARVQPYLAGLFHRFLQAHRAL